jgi:phosphohistidine swiveling domain-containing protein
MKRTGEGDPMSTATSSVAPKRAAASFSVRLQVSLRERTWVKGAVNYDEDLHFSSYYLRASGAQATGSMYPGYSSVVASYEGFRETYWLLEDECRGTAAAIVDRALEDPRWLPRVLRTIQKRSDALARIFPSRTSADSLGRLSGARLLALYDRHDEAHRALYVPARLPEALDRGVSYFTSYLVEHLRSRGLDAAEARRTFQALTEPVVPSVLSQEIADFDAIVEAARSRSEDLPPASIGAGRARMLLPPRILERLESHVARWRFLPYHGYGRRRLASLEDAVGRLLAEVAAPRRTPSVGAPRRRDVLERLGLDARHAALFLVYPEIGATKLYRRSAQLANFYFLDLLLAEIARRLDVSEWTVRCLLPEEVRASLRAGRLVSASAPARLDGCVFAILHGEERVLVGGEAESARRLLAPEGAPSGDGSVLRGVVACPGRARGRCKVVIRADGEALAPGTIVVSESTDPDLVPLLRVAGAVLTEQGGVTSHAAIVCRELGVPTIIGIDGLLERVRDGDWLEVDAESGTVTLVESRSTAPVASGDTGAKARNLGIVRSLGFQVPEYVVLSHEEARRAARAPESGATRELVDRVLAELGLGAEAKLAVRSSALSEDGEDASGAGDFTSLLDVKPCELAPALARFVAANEAGRSGAAYRGSVIVQRLVRPECSGVCLTRDARSRGANALVLEMTAGANVGITGGTVRPDRFVVDRVTGDVLEEARSSRERLGLPVDVTGLAREFLRLEAGFGRALDIEWALEGGTLLILQARPIANGVLSGRDRA